MKELLDTDRVNYLIWRYLLESNYRETAAKLQKEWRIQTPHKHFEFAQHVKTYALVNLLNKGLQFETFERQFAEQKAPRDVPATAEATPRGVFGPLKFQPEMMEEEDDDEEEESEQDAEYDEEIDNPRKRAVDRHLAMSHGSPAKRQRLSNGYDNGADSATTPMEIDHHHGADNNHAYPSPLEGEQAASPLPHTEGPSRGTQVDKTQDLTHDTVFLRLGADDSTEARENPIVLISKWNPKDPSILATGGTDALARIWTLPRGAAPDAALPDHVDTAPRYLHLGDDLPGDSTVISMAWSSNGALIALGIEIGNKSRLGVWAADGTNAYRFEGLDSPITNLCWSPHDNFLLAISPDLTNGLENPGTLIQVSSPSMVNPISHILNYDLHSYPVDATWIGESSFVLCGQGLLTAFRCTDKEVVQSKEFETRKDERFQFVKFDWRSSLVATGSEAGFIDIWDESSRRRSIQAHDGAITAMQWQPLQADPVEGERLLVSCGVDGTILVWNVLSQDPRPKYSINLDSPLAANSLAISPDGSHIAVATHDRILIWKLGEHQVPKAGWIPQSGWQTPKTGSDSGDSLPFLEWDCEGRRLVHGMDSRLALINFR
ncbi:WD40-repeat-containing domain protein [Apiosordaria backusii]|uniref:WD40-repeat-containing domain protein n=1 Tax=Apiosordaria backusii TaxID=314023 RepID=A0AA40EY67_9PEZI|nr:WD40-repeat-containing domain protein [Apiosordaria backusii]